MPFKKSESAGYLINHTARIFFNELHEKIAPLGLAPAQFLVLLELWQEDGVTQKELVGRLDVEQATMANTIARMERDGLIERRPNPDDGRSRSIYITEKAKGLRTAATNSADSVNRKLLAALSPTEQDQFIQTMQKIIAHTKNG